jgi:hypothetical protein
VLKRKFHAASIVLGKRADTKIDTRKIQSLARAQFTADGDPAMDIIASHTFHLQLDQSVVEKESVANLYYPRQLLKTHGHSMVITYDVSTGKNKVVADSHLNGLRVDLPEPHFWPRQIGHNGDHSAYSLLCSSDPSDELAMMCEISMGKIQPGDVEPGLNQTLQDFQ